MASFLCRFGIHRRHKPGRNIWHCRRCPSLWVRRHDDRAHFWWEKIR